jgi:hypothetical protein
MKWSEHVLRMNEDGIPNVFNTKLKKKNNAQLGD